MGWMAAWLGRIAPLSANSIQAEFLLIIEASPTILTFEAISPKLSGDRNGEESGCVLPSKHGLDPMGRGGILPAIWSAGVGADSEQFNVSELVGGVS